MTNARSSRDYLIADQFSAAVVDSINKERVLNELIAQSAQDQAFNKAIEQITKIREFVGSPDRILGSELTKHGEIAEQVEVGIRNAQSALQQQNLTATFEGVGRTAPADYLIDGISVQSKFINGLSNNLDHVIEHMDKYANFGRDGSYYHIPKDSHETILKILNGESVEGLSQKTINALTQKVQEIEQKAGQSFTEVVKPGLSNYVEVQQGNITSTLEKHQKIIESENNKIKENIAQQHQASLSEAAKAAAIGGVIGGAVSLTAGLYSKHKQGKNLLNGDFTAEDWKELGITTAQGAVGGAVAGGSIYLITNYAALSAPFAGAVVSAAKGISSLVKDYYSGRIDYSEFINLGLVVCAESSTVGLAAAVGQILIPIPALGAVLGSIAGKMLSEFLASSDKQLAERINADMDIFIKKLDDAKRRIVSAINAEYDRLGALTKAAFDVDRNIGLLQSSINLAKAYGVKDDLIISTHSQLDDFILA